MDIPKDLNYKILLELDDKSLVRFCQVNRKANSICNDQTFWLNRILTKFPYIPIEMLNKYKGDRTWSNYYIHDLRVVNKSVDRLKILKSINDDRLDHLMILTNNKIYCSDALYIAIINHRLEIIKYLLRVGYQIEFFDFLVAVRRGYLDVVKLLVENGANVNDFDPDYDTPLQEAIRRGHTEVADYLISKGAK